MESKKSKFNVLHNIIYKPITYTINYSESNSTEAK